MYDTIFSVFLGSGHYIPQEVVKNEVFLDSDFFDSAGQKLSSSNSEIIQKFYNITGIEERRYADAEHVASDIGFFAAEDTIISSGIDREDIDHIIVAHNFGDVNMHLRRPDTVPSLAARIKKKLRIQNPYCVAYDMTFGCAGWLQSVIQADYYIRSGDIRNVLVIGTETLSRVSDPHDRDSMIYSDGAGAVILSARKQQQPVGIIAHLTRSDTLNHANLLSMGRSNNLDSNSQDQFLKMEGRKLYEYGLNTVPQLIKDCMDKAGIGISDVKKLLIHQANAKMDDAMLSRLLKLYNVDAIPDYIMPMTIAKFGNNSVATLPVLLDLVLKDKMENHRLYSGDYIIFASLGAGMNANVVIYKMP